ncbi:NUDIX hydrolase [Nevskia soli]|uniref:NUDIX hydrolase n=1 Tax=Nevskia soli TaxID=418856 RepID=UPI0004A6B559|nr:NUDIX hydrolase [Nevskia soli]
MGWNAHITVACVVERAGRFLLVEERADDGRLVLNQPAGHWEEGETLQDAAVRETLEESAWDVAPTDLVGLYAYKPVHLDHGFLRVAFAARALRHHPQRPLDEGIERAVWMSREELAACVDRHRSPMVLLAIDDYLAGKRYPLDLVHHLR